MNDLTHASFFSGVGGLDLGLERAGWRTVSFSEIDPYANAVLAERWPGIPNLGSIIDLPDPPESATLWTGGFPCQDLSIAGKRRGMVDGSRSNLAHAFLELVGRHHPRFILLENVPGLLSSHRGKDMAILLGAMAELGYGVGYRTFDAQFFDVPQRRQRVFILGDSLGGRAGAERAAEVLSVGSRCRRHPPTGGKAGPGATNGSVRSSDGASGPDVHGSLSIGGHVGLQPNGQDAYTGHLIANSDPPNDAGGQGRRRQGSTGVGGYESDPGDQPDADALRRTSGASADTGRVRAPDGLAGRVDGSRELAATLNSGGNNGGFRTEPGEHLVAYNPYRTLERDGSVTSGYGVRDVVDALHGPTGNKEPLFLGGRVADDELLPLGLDSHRYRCCGNGVVSDVAEWIGHRLAAIA